MFSQLNLGFKLKEEEEEEKEGEKKTEPTGSILFPFGQKLQTEHGHMIRILNLR